VGLNVTGGGSIRQGSRLKGRRANSGRTQLELANLVEVSWNTIARLETGGCRPSIQLLHRLAEAFGCSVDDLLPVKDRTAMPQRRIAAAARMNRKRAKRGGQ
jgi:DNA-binding XRE family transcriptional regulator